MVTVAVPLPELATALTTIVVVMLSPLPLDLVGTPLGAENSPLVEMKPSDWLPPGMPFTCQVTPLAEDVNCCVPKAGTVAALGDTLTEPDAEVAVTVTVAAADFVLSA
jgi:hypothetical protein